MMASVESQPIEASAARDLEEEGIPILSTDTLQRDLNSRLKAPSFAASAVKGDNVAATMKKIIALTVGSLRKKLE